MATYNYKPGLGNVGSYQASAVPYVLGNIDATTVVRVSFPSVTSWVVVTNGTAAACKIGFSSLGITANDNYITVPPLSISPKLDLKVTELYLECTATGVDVCAGLTAIESSNINNSAVSPSGSNWSGSLGALVG